MAEWPVDETYVVIGMDEDAVLDRAKLPGATILVDPGWKEGTASALRVGLDMLTRMGGADAALVAGVTVPGIGLDVVERMLDTFSEVDRYAVVPKYRYSRGQPFLLGKQIWGRMMGLEGDTTIEAVLSTHPEWVEEVWVDRLAPRSIGNLDDLRDIRRRS
jgi:CTP:molybdopterin cytidylyltransferase MocA